MAEGLFCGDANKGGDIALWFRGACKESIELEKSFRCTGCGGWFHFDCIFDHFEQERDHSIAHNALRRILDCIDTLKPDEVRIIAQEGLKREKPRSAFSKLFEKINAR